MRMTSLTGRTGLPLAVAALALLASAGVAQDSAPAQESVGGLRLPQNITVYGEPLPKVVKATVIVNGEVITQTDINQRLALLAMSSQQEIPPEEMERLKQQVLRNLVDETLQIQAAKAEEIEVKPQEIDRAVARVAGNAKKTPTELAAYLASNGSSIRSIRRQIEGELAWRRLQSAKIENSVSIGDDEVKAVIDKLEASKGTQEFRVSEIFLPATVANHDEMMANAQKLLEALRQGGSFAGYARQYSQASTAAVGGDLGWVRPEQLPNPLDKAVKDLNPGSVSIPLDVPGGISIIAVQDVRTILAKDPRNALLNLKQVSIAFPASTTKDQAEGKVAAFAKASLSIGGCGGAEKLASDFGGEVVQSDQVKLRDLPQALQEMMLPMQIGQATRPFGNLQEGVRVLVMCGRDEVENTLPTYDEVFAQLNEERTNTRARRYLRDLRRDAVIDFR